MPFPNPFSPPPQSAASESENESDLHQTFSSDTDDSAVGALRALSFAPENGESALGKMENENEDDLPVSMSSTSLMAGAIPADNGELPVSMSSTSLMAGKIPADISDDDDDADDKEAGAEAETPSKRGLFGLFGGPDDKDTDKDKDDDDAKDNDAAEAATAKDDDEEDKNVFDHIGAWAAGVGAALGLGAAVADQDTEAEPADVAEAQVAEGEEKGAEAPEEGKKQNRAKLCLCAAFAALLLILLAVGLGLGLSRRNTGGGGGPMAPTMAPEPVPGAPTASPVAGGATSAPTAFQTFDILLAYLGTISPDGGAALQDPASPQYQAAEWLYTNPGLAGYTETEINQRYALATTYLATDGDNWRLKNGWMEPEVNECQWIGIGCETQLAPGRKLGEEDSRSNGSLRGKNSHEAQNEERRTQARIMVVKKVQLFELALSGPLPSEIAILTETVDLSCYGNSITGSIPDAIGDMEGLEILQLDGNQMSGTLPASIFDLKALTKVRLEANFFSGTVPATLGQLSNLVDFRVESNMLTGEINPDVCAFDLKRLSSDCGGDPPQIECSCCTQCFLGQ
jgi:hypothetical protein